MCSEPSFLADDSFFVNCQHILTAIVVPIHLFGAYIVLAKTPQKMISVKQSMIILHCLGAFVDIYMSCITIPVLTVPFCAGYPLGLAVLLGIRTDVQLYIGFSLVAMVCTAILSFFEDRFFVFGNGGDNQRNWKRKAYILVNYFLSATYILPAFLNIPDQTTGKLAMLQVIPCFPVDLFSRSGFFILAIDNTICFICTLFMLLFLTSQLIFFAIGITQKLSGSSTKSKNTYRLQKQFMFALYIQVTVPITIFCFPISIVLWASQINYYNQAFINISFMFLCCHGLASTVTMLVAHRPYRDAAINILCFKAKEPDTNTGSKIWKTGSGAVALSI